MFLKKREIMKVLCTGAYHNNLKIESLYEPSEYSDGGFPEEIYAIYNWSEPYPWTIHKENIEKFVSLCKAHGIQLFHSMKHKTKNNSEVFELVQKNFILAEGESLKMLDKMRDDYQKYIDAEDEKYEEEEDFDQES